MSLFRRFTRFAKLGKEKYYVGADLQGNSFYERPSVEDPSDWRHAKRSVVYTGPPKPLSEYRFHSLPVQWNAWMRRTRQDPPSIEELEIDFFRQQSVAANVERLAIEYKEEKLRMIEPPVEEILRKTVKPIEAPVEQSKIKELKLGSINGAPPVQQGETDRQRTQSILRREQDSSAPAVAKGNPDSSFQPQGWAPKVVRR